jgi:hypothetical protein
MAAFVKRAAELFRASDSPETSPLKMGRRELQAELGRFLSKVLDLLLAVSSVVVFRTFVDVLLTVLQHAIDQSGQATSRSFPAIFIQKKPVQS